MTQKIIRGPKAAIDSLFTRGRGKDAAPLPKILIIARVGARSLHRSWLWTCGTAVDIALSSYDGADFSMDQAAYHHAVPGGKLQGIQHFVMQNPEVMDRYDYFWLFEDDLFLPRETVDKVKALLQVFPFSLCAPALSPFSFFTYALTLKNNRFLLRATDTVEVMSPIMSRAFFKQALPFFGENFSSWGQEWMWRRILKENNDFAIILDDAEIVHTRPCGPDGQGSIYKNMPSSVSPFEEKEAFLRKHNLERHEFINLFGLLAADTPHLVFNEDLLLEMTHGYDAAFRLDKDRYGQCIGAVYQQASALTKEDFMKLPQFRALYAKLFT